MNTKRMIAALAVLAIAFAAFAAFAAIPGEVVSEADDLEIVEIKGDFTSQMIFTTSQKVVVVEDLNIIDGGQITIDGDFVVNSGVTVTIEGDNGKTGTDYLLSELNLMGDATINGNIVTKTGVDRGSGSYEYGLFILPIHDYNRIVINGNITALGDTSGVTKPVLYARAYYEGVQGYHAETITINGDVTVGTNAYADLAHPLFAKDSKLAVLGEVCGVVYANSYVYFDGAVDSTFEIYMSSADAVVDIVSVTGGEIEVTDDGVYAYNYGGLDYYISWVPPYAADTATKAIDADFNDIVGNWIYMSNVTNLRITAKITTELVYDEDISDNRMTAATKLMVSALDVEKKVETVEGKLGYIETKYGATTYFESMTISDVAVTIDGKSDDVITTIEGDVIFLLSNLKDENGNLTQVFTVKSYDGRSHTGQLNVTGTLVIKKDDIKSPTDEGYSMGIINAAHYAVKNDDHTEDNYYTTLKKAIDNGAKTIDMKGQLIVKEDITVPAGVTVKIAEIEYKEADTITDDVYAVIIEEGATLKIADGASFKMPIPEEGKAYAMKVDGSFHIENINSGIVLAEDKNIIFADVLLKDGASRIYTNIYSAVAQAKSDAEIEAYNPAPVEIKGIQDATQAVVIDKDLIIPAGVQFDNNTFAILVNNGITLTVAGKLIIDDEDLLIAEENGWNDQTSKAAGGEMKDYSVIAVGPKGIIEFQALAEELDEGLGVYTDNLVTGAYFQKDSKYYITDVAYAFENILDTDLSLDWYDLKKYNVFVAGEVTIDGLKVSGTEGKRIAVKFVSADVTLKNFTFAYGSVTFGDDTVVSGSIGASKGSVEFSDKSVKGYSMKFGEEFVDDAMNLVVSGDIGTYDTVTFNGTVYVTERLQIMGSARETGADNEAEFIISKNCNFIVTGKSAKLMFNGGDFIVDGILTITNEANLNCSAMYVVGTLDVQKVDGKAATATIFLLIVGTASDKYDDMKSTSALVTGSGTFSMSLYDLVSIPLYVNVYNGSNIEADALAYWIEEEAVSTERYVDGKLLCTMYVQNDKSIYFAMSTYDGDTLVSVEYDHPTFENMTFNAWQTYDEKTGKYSDIVPSADEIYAALGDVRYQKIYADISRNIYNIEVVADVGIDNVYVDGILLLKDKTSNTYSGTVATGTHTITYALANGYSGNAVITAIDGKSVTGTGLTFTIDDDKYDSVADEMVITISGIEKSGIDTDPDTHAEETVAGLTVTEILLIVVVIIIAVMAIVLILRLSRS